MRQTATICETVLYTLQPGDGTRYTFSIGCLSSKAHSTRIFETVHDKLPKITDKHPEITYERIEATTNPAHNDTGLHFVGWNRDEKIYIVSIYSPSIACFSVSENMLSLLRSDNSYLIDYLRSEQRHANRYTMFIVLACLEILTCTNKLPSADRMQRALISARTILETTAFKGES